MSQQNNDLISFHIVFRDEELHKSMMAHCNPEAIIDQNVEKTVIRAEKTVDSNGGIYSTGKNYLALTPQEALSNFEKEFPNAQFIALYNPSFLNGNR